MGAPKGAPVSPPSTISSTATRRRGDIASPAKFQATSKVRARLRPGGECRSGARASSAALPRSKSIRVRCSEDSNSSPPRGARQEPQQIEGAGQSRAFDRSYQARVRLRQGALPRAQEERASPDRDLRLGQSLYSTPDSTPATIAIRRGVICLISGKHPKQAPKPNQTAAFSACGLASSATPHQCHASLPRDQPLFRRSLTPQRATPWQVVDGLLQYQLTRGWRQCRPRYQASR